MATHTPETRRNTAKRPPADLFWRDLQRDLEDPAFAAEYQRQSARIAMIDRIINALDDARVAMRMSKAELARAVGCDPAAIRRLFSARGNPTLGTVSDIAAALGMQVELAPTSVEQAGEIAAPPMRAARKPTASGHRAGQDR